MNLPCSSLPCWLVASVAAVLPCLSQAAAPTPLPTGAPSRVPAYTYPTTLPEQEAALAANPLLQRMNAVRAKLATDRFRPAYHYVNPEGTLNDPNGLCFWQGRWHLFYQAYPPEDTRQHWGHAVSEDLIHWRDLPYAIYPGPEDKCYSGTTLVEKDRVIAIYHGVAAGTMVAISQDPLLLNWSKLTGRAVIPFPAPGQPGLPYEIFDPGVWKKGEDYYALTAGQLPTGPGGKYVRALYLHRSRDLATWTYLHPFLESDLFSKIGDDGACPYFWPIGDRHLLLHYSHTRGGRYLLGKYDTARDKFVVTDGGTFNHGASGPGGVHAPSAYPDGQGGIIAIFNMNPAFRTAGWNQIMTLPMRLSLPPAGEVDPLRIEPVAAVESLRGAHRRIENRKLPANQDVVLEGIAGNCLELALEVAPTGGQTIELEVLRSPQREEYTRIAFYRERGDIHREFGNASPLVRPASSVLVIDNARSSQLPDARSRPPETAQFRLKGDEPLKLRVFIDRSVVEVYANGRQYAALRVYPGREDSVGVALRSLGRDSTVRSVEAWQMRPVW
ncbi:MAG: glycoside hydrolase family 32 protein [Verrucomicrobia bacterium]|nr:glycoside hydrolase family 32 protein [Verrucomicrobiota bacterium]